jgi:hypothetical protein
MGYPTATLIPGHGEKELRAAGREEGKAEEKG